MLPQESKSSTLLECSTSYVDSPASSSVVLLSQSDHQLRSKRSEGDGQLQSVQELGPGAESNSPVSGTASNPSVITAQTAGTERTELNSSMVSPVDRNSYSTTLETGSHGAQPNRAASAPVQSQPINVPELTPSHSEGGVIHDLANGKQTTGASSQSTSENSRSSDESGDKVFLPIDVQKTVFIRGPATNRRWGFSNNIGLKGGSEASTLNAGTAQWGAPPPSGTQWGAQPPNPQPSQWGLNSNSPQQTQWGTPTATQNRIQAPPPTAQSQSGMTQQPPSPLTQPQQQGAGWGQPPKPQLSPTNSQPPQGQQNSPSQSGAGIPSINNNMSKTLEQLSNIKEVIFAQDGWSSSNVVQESRWDVPASPEPANKEVPMWKQTASNGTEVWEAYLRSGGATTAPPVDNTPKTPWGRAPKTNFGGTWDEEDDTPESASMWTGVPPASQAPPPQPWGVVPPMGGPPSGQQQAPQTPMWKKDGDWGSMGPSAAGPGWSDRGMGVVRPELGVGPAPWQQGKPPGSMGGGQWGGALPPKDLTKPTGWDDPTMQAIKRANSIDDGTNLWGTAQKPSTGWQEMPNPKMGGRGMPSGPPPRAPPGGVNPDISWGAGPPHNVPWPDAGREPGWGLDEVPTTPSWMKKVPSVGPGGWGVEPDMYEPSWPGSGRGPQRPTREMVWNSKPYRILIEMGFKKEDVETALINSSGKLEDALEMLNAGRQNMFGGDLNRDMPPFDPSYSNRFGGQTSQNMQFGSQAGLVSGMSKFLPNQQVPPPMATRQPSQPPMMYPGRGAMGRSDIRAEAAPSGGANAANQNQVRYLVSQIQMAVTAGHLNPQILNQPLAPQTLYLLNQLLQQIKTLQTLTAEHQQMMARRGQVPQPTIQRVVQQVAQVKNQISSLQAQIQTQQNMFIKQGGSSAPFLGGADPFKDSIASISAGLQNMAVQEGHSSQSRLGTWKLPSLDSKESDYAMDFMRAPGSAGAGKFNSPSDTWSTLSRNTSESGWPDSTASEVGTASDSGKDTWSSVPNQQAYSSISDLVPEFEPGKPWKGHPIKSVDDDPTLTPGQFALSSLKDSDIFQSGKQSPSQQPSVTGDFTPLTSLSSNAWSFSTTTSTSTTPAFGGGLGKFGGNGGTKSTWADTTPSSADLWNAGSVKGGASRGPPPGIKGSQSWGTGQSRSGGSNWGGNGSPWLLLRNLTPQIDGSTLKTLCLQHGPLQNFHLYLNHGIALVRYSSGDEAAKAQCALNSCVLGNTTILAEVPSETDVHAWLSQLGGGSSNNQSQWQGMRGSTPTSKQTNDGWGVWANSSGVASASGSSVWSAPSLEREGNSGMNASLNAFLPGDLLGGESM
ncbi:protein Gawky-like isoform X2 [Artemia franciscana]|uniref:UBA domain-containing protein n=1 Tax=Artemia franciscana TaxID=6661 RepID=A0AA88HPC3_ARTSF|nr:hypothetical protein QYM36_012521 [Artemia franciscana]